MHPLGGLSPLGKTRREKRGRGKNTASPLVERRGRGVRGEESCDRNRKLDNVNSVCIVRDRCSLTYRMYVIHYSYRV